ncbi:hypothetical protein E5S70_24260 [Ensifer adhaerens]|uniref:hypothetical protein n=1 Tax=Ensifer canadensis TaxID=555315 RepID=UPI00148F6DF2|nr:hypothetical protein [Ensifer canadensis]NOV19157.1 hypothetical protein [Ensifer canadensis]
MDAIESYLRQHGPCLTTEVAAHIMRIGNLAPNTARQRVSRRSDAIKSLAYLPFPRNARFLYLPEDYGSPRFWRALIDRLDSTNSAYGAALGAVLARGGIVPEAHFNIVCGAPVRQKKHVSAELVLERLLEAKLLERRHIDGIGSCIIQPRGAGYLEWPAVEVRARLLSENILLSAIAAWARNNGLVSYGKVQLRSMTQAPAVATTVWDFTGPCYLHSVLPRVRDGETQRPAFLVADVLQGRVDLSGIRAFVRKCEAVRRLSKVTSLQMFVADHYSREARDLLKSQGIITATTRSLFGKDFQTGLNELKSFFGSIIQNSAIDIGKLDALLRRFNEIEGASLQIRGTLFEFLAARLARFEFRSDVVLMNRVYQDASTPAAKAEADLTVEAGGRQLVFVECKGTAPYGIVPDEQFEKWLQHQVPTIYAATRHRPEWANREITFEFWATAPLSEASQELFRTIESALNKHRYQIKVRLGEELESMCERMGDESVTTAFGKHFVRRGRPQEGAFA